MALNEHPCVECMHYDVIKPGNVEKKLAPGQHGWCAVKSVYPYKEQEGQTFPPGVRRAAPGMFPLPVIVVGTEVVGHCTDFRALPQAPR